MNDPLRLVLLRRRTVPALGPARALLVVLASMPVALAQSGDPGMDPPAAARSSGAAPRPMRTEGIRELAGLERHAVVQAVVAPRRIAPGEQGVVHVIVEPREGRGLDRLRIALRPTPGSGVRSIDTGTMGTGTHQDDEQASVRVVSVPVTFSADLAHGDVTLPVEVVADVRHTVEQRTMGRWRTTVEATARLGNPLPRPSPRASDGGAAPSRRPSIEHTSSRPASVFGDFESAAGRGGNRDPRGRQRGGHLQDPAPRPATTPGRWVRLAAAFLVPLLLALVAARWLWGTGSWARTQRDGSGPTRGCRRAAAKRHLGA